MERRAFLKVVGAHLALAACSREGTTKVAVPEFTTPTTTTPPPTTPPVPFVSSTTLPQPAVPGGIVRKIDSPKSPAFIQHDADVPEFWLQMLAETVGIGQSELRDSGPLTIYSYSTADTFAPAYAKVFHLGEDTVRSRLPTFRSEGGRGYIWQYLPNHLTPSATQSRFPRPGARAPSPPVNFLHEYFHTLQGWLLPAGNLSLIPAWLQEGSADHFAIRLGTELGLETSLTPGWPHPPETFEQKRNDAVTQVSRSAQTLSEFEARSPERIPPIAYAFGNIATELLIRNFGIEKTLHQIYATVRPNKDWKQAFLEVFGNPVDQFYADFETYRKTL